MLERHHIFVSHATRPTADSREVVSALVATLRESRISVFLDLDSFSSGLPILPSLEAAIADARSAILVITERGAASAWTGWERQRIRERQLTGSFPVIALHFDSELPTDLTWATVIEADPRVPVEQIAREILLCLAGLGLLP